MRLCREQKRRVFDKCTGIISFSPLAPVVFTYSIRQILAYLGSLLHYKYMIYFVCTHISVYASFLFRCYIFYAM